MLGLFYGLNQFMDELCYDFDVALVPFSRRFWIFDVAKGERTKVEFIMNLGINSNLKGE